MVGAELYPRLQSLLFSLDPERAHRLAMSAAGIAKQVSPGYLRAQFSFEHPALQTTVFGHHFPNPIGLAAGFDKNASRLGFWPLLGFGFVEAGSVSARPARGNPRPRAFRLPTDRALVNRMGLNNVGARRIARRLSAEIGDVPIPVGVNIAKTHDPSIEGEAAVEDYVQSFRALAPHAAYVALNISCPNTSEGKTFESEDALDALLRAVFEERRTLSLDVPVLVKLSPPYSTRVVFDSLVEEVLRVCDAHEIDGYIATNTASDRHGLQTPIEEVQAVGSGGMSGAPLRERSTHLVRYLYRRTEGAVPIIGVGGVDSAEAAYEKIRAGASLVQLYTGLVYEGPGLIRDMKEGLVTLLEGDGYTSVAEAVGADA